ncbi:AMP-binding protein [Amycolatopsis saalfeldensis]|uniref:Crotonobetaine/carnitine-CoA ligase n=1 Tax=Amycolatopsis saalfeldensis TaxID=394193 RepID=A0A1H8XY05_9PSEU|nr:AMP-binding protein [Amycolatopsis saalfeldensis]SEP44755.1 crotonobetaine/carnitine-CoA ligase [Amycolatopsis saalfeldensis]
MHPITDLPTLLALRAESYGNKTLLSHSDRCYTYREMDEESSRFAGALHEMGVKKQDSVAVMLPNCGEYIVAWMGIARLGAVQVGINTDYVGAGLAHLLELGEAKVLVVAEQYLPAIAEIAASLPKLETVIVAGELAGAPDLGPQTVCSFSSALRSDCRPPEVELAGTDLLMLIFTSGTTGPAKAVSISHAYCLDLARHLIRNFEYRESDVLYSCYPLFHTDAAILTYVTALVLGATAALGQKFSARRFWSDVRRHDATVFDFMGAVLAILLKQPPHPDERRHRVRLAMGGPKPDNWPEFEARFGVKVVEIYGATEMGHPVWDPLTGSRRAGAAGRIDTGRYELRIVDQADNEVPTGTSGEIVVRPRFADQHMSGYYRDPDETVRAWRNLWYHTRDRGRVDEDEWLYFEGRMSDAIRKRGNNMSATEIEEVLQGHHEVVEAAAIGVPSELTEEDVKVVVVPREPGWRDAQGLVEWTRGRMPEYMRPRYVEFVEELPKSSTGKVRKAELRSVWDQGTVYDAGDGGRTSTGRWLSSGRS